MVNSGEFRAVALAILVSIPIALSAQPTVAEGQVLTSERLEEIRKLGELTGVGLYCGYFDDAVPLKEVIIEVADKNKLDETQRAQMGKVYHSSRDLTFNNGKQGGFDCPKLAIYRSEALLGKMTVYQAFE